MSCVPVMCLLAVLVGLSLGLIGCQPSGDSTLQSAPVTPTSRTESQAVDNLLQLYSQALRQEDIDRLQALLLPEAITASATNAFRQALANTFRRYAVSHHTILPATVEVADDHSQVSFVEVESGVDPVFQFHHSRVYQTTLRLERLASAETVRFRIAGVQRDGPIVDIATQGQVQADVRSRVTVSTSEARFALGRADIVDPATGATRALRATAAGFEGSFTASERGTAFTVQLHDRSGEWLAVSHPYVARRLDDAVVAFVPGTDGTRLQAIAIGPDGTVWTGGDRGANLYRVTPGATQAELVRPLLSDPSGRIEDLVVDALGRLHAVVFSPQRSGVIVRDQDTFCQTVNVLDASYPLRDAAGQPSVSTRAVAASEGAIWLLGSDAGVVEVRDGFTDGECPVSGVEVQYGTVLRREEGVLPVNTVPALELSADGVLWLGSALGLGRLQEGQLTEVPFDPSLSFQGDAATLETFFQEVARAIFESRPIETVALGEVSFIDAFGSALVKEDLIFSLTQDHERGLWLGTLGGGIRRVEVRGGTIEQTLHVTREDGLASNVVLALSASPDGAIWAATDEGVSRIEAHGDQVAITTYTVLDGLSLPARDIAIDAQGMVWVATDGGLFRIQSPQGQVMGQVHDANAQAVVEAEVVVHGTSVRTVTDAEGRFEAGAIPPGQYLLQVDGSTSTHGVYGTAFRDITVRMGTQELAPIVIDPIGPGQPVDVVHGGVVTFPHAPGAALEIPPQTAQFPEGASAAIGLTLLPPQALPGPLPSGFTGTVAAEIEPSSVTFTTPARLTLPNVGQLSPAVRSVQFLAIVGRFRHPRNHPRYRGGR